MMKPALRTELARLAYLPRALGLVWSAAPAWTLLWAALLVVQGLLPAATVSLTRLLVDRLVAAIGGGWEQLRPTLFVAVVMAGIVLLTEVLHSVSEWVRAAQSEFVQDHISALIHRQSVAVDLGFYDSAEYYDQLHRARDDASTRPQVLLESLGGLLQDGITLLAMAAIVLPYGAWLPLALLASVVPALLVVLRFDWRIYQWWKRTTADRRWTWYYEWMLTGSEAAAEIRLFSLGEHFQSAYQTLRRRLRGERLRLLRDQSLARMSAGAGGLAISGAAMAWMVWRAVQGRVTLGDLALFYQAFQRGQGLARSLLGNVEQIYSSSLFLGNLFEFLDLRPQIRNPQEPLRAPARLRTGIRFRDVTFRYPGGERPTLRDFNLTVPAEQTVAIVGANGAGKSTLVKLLCRFYDPERGCVELDGVDIRDLSIEELRRQITVLFQSPVPYHATAGQNIGLGDLTAAPDAAAIESAAGGAGAHEIVMRLPQGYETLLGRWFADGAELSEGEWQRIALARAFLRRGQIVVLDEPTSAMDSWAETEWLERFRALVDGRTAIIITHRLTTAMRADIIHVMHDGVIVEWGSHDELLASGGRYAESWLAQMQTSSGVEL
jgi:ATP-binding cassette subfamily B protein